MKRIICIAMSLSLLCMLTSCAKDDDNPDPGNNENNGHSTEKTDKALLDKAAYCMGYAIGVSRSYNDEKQSPSSISNKEGKTVAYVNYQPNGSLHFMSFTPLPPLSSPKLVPFVLDLGRRPSAICLIQDTDIALATNNTLLKGTYDYSADPAKILACFGGYNGNGVFTSLERLRTVANNPEISKDLYDAISFPNNCYKIILFGKNKAGKVTGKYVGYAQGESYYYWCIDSESASYGKKGSVKFP